MTHLINTWLLSGILPTFGEMIGHMTHDLGLMAPCSRDQGPPFSDPKALFLHGQGKERTINTCRRLLMQR